MSEEKTVTIRVQRGNHTMGITYDEFTVPVIPGMVVLDAVTAAQSSFAQDLSVRWNCKAGKCGSCGAEIDGMPKLMCMTRIDDLDISKPVEIRPMRSFPIIKDLVTDVSWNYAVNKSIRKFKPPATEGPLIMFQNEVDRVQEFRKCIECFLCQNTCHVIRTHQAKDEFAGPRFMARLASLEMHPQDTDTERLRDIKDKHHVSYCNITRCCTEVCPEDIKLTDNALIPLKERVVSEFYDPLTKFGRVIKNLL